MFILWSWIRVAILVFYKSIYMKKNDTQDYCLIVTSVNSLSMMVELGSPIWVQERFHESFVVAEEQKILFLFLLSL